MNTKTVLHFIISILAVRTACAQGTVAFVNRDASLLVDAPIYDLAVGGVKLEGTGYWAQLFAGPEGTPASALQPVGAAVHFGVGADAGYVGAGPDVSRSVPEVGWGQPARIQIRAWSANGGATWESAYRFYLFDLTVHLGSSGTLTVLTAANPSSLPAALLGLESFASGPLVAIDEPSMMVLGIAGMAACFFRRCALRE